jgi:rfaE bifunctional protein nucleotidyltransferase chain/domain
MSAAANVVTMDELLERLTEPRRSGQTVALANGLFDILHVGHLRYLEAASEEADILVVAINSDESARRLKGPSRPVCPELERAELIAGLACVDHVTIFTGDTVEGPLRDLRPEVHCKGTDYTSDSVPEAGLARELGIRVAIVGDHKSHSTRDIISKLKKT